MVDSKSRNPHALYCDELSLTKQSFKEECDINVIIDRARNGVDISHINARVAQYGDFTNVPDYRTALDMVNRANGMFMELDAKVRERFANDPARMIDFLQQPGNYDEAVRLGLVKAREPMADVGGDKPPVSDIPPLESNPSPLGDDPGEGFQSRKANSGAKEAKPKGGAK